MIRAFELAIGQLGDPKLRSLIGWSLLLSLVLQVAIAGLGIWGLRSLAVFETRWINEAIVWLSGTGVVETVADAGAASASAAARRAAKNRFMISLSMSARICSG